jgi:hypothetical protein
VSGQGRRAGVLTRYNTQWTAGDITDPFIDRWGFDRAQQQLEIFNKMKDLLPVGFR